MRVWSETIPPPLRWMIPPPEMNEYTYVLGRQLCMMHSPVTRERPAIHMITRSIWRALDFMRLAGLCLNTSVQKRACVLGQRYVLGRRGETAPLTHSFCRAGALFPFGCQEKAEHVYVAPRLTCAFSHGRSPPYILANTIFIFAPPPRE